MQPKRHKTLDARAVSLLSAVFLAFVLGVAVGDYRFFPFAVFNEAREGFFELCRQTMPARLPGALNEKARGWYYRQAARPHPPAIINTPRAFNGLNLVTRVTSDLRLSADILDMEGRRLHSWDLDWFHIWPNPDHLPMEHVPTLRPATHIHGALILENSDLVFNFEHLGLVRIDRNGNIVWRLPYRTHHAIHRHDDGNLWVTGQRRRTNGNPLFPLRKPPFDEYTLLEVSPGGNIIGEWSVSDILAENGRGGLLFAGPPEPSLYVLDDRIHLNDVEPFPSTMAEGFFTSGDILVSLRNVNTVFVFNRHTGKLKYISTGMFIRQHDPDFIDGNTFSVFDNNAVPMGGPSHSRIVVVSLPEDKAEVFFEGSPQNPFFTAIMGKHQWLPNGNLLITESVAGRAFEISPQGETVWQYINYVDAGIVALVEEVQRLPAETRQWFPDRERSAKEKETAS